MPQGANSSASSGSAVEYFKGVFGTTDGDLPSSGSVNGDMYICDTDAYTSVVAGLTFDNGDQAIYDGTVWYKLDNTESVAAFNGRKGNVLPTAGDYSKSDVGLGSVDNTSDANKPVATSQQTALNLKATLDSPTFTGTVGGITASMVGLTNVDNTADTAKPVSTVQQTALNLKANAANVSNVDNTSDASKPVSTAQQTESDTKLDKILLLNNTATGAYSLVAGDNGKLVTIDTGLTIPTGLSIGFQSSVFLNNATAQTLTTTGLTVKGNDQAAKISGNGIITIAVIATNTVLIAGEMEA